MAGLTGTHDVSSLLAARLSAIPNFESRNLDQIQTVVEDELAGHNAQMDMMISELCDITTARDGVYGSTAGGSMKEVDEYGRTATQRSAPGETFGIPLRKYQYAVGWTATWMRNKKPVDLAVALIAAQTADRKRVVHEIKKALFVSPNYSFYDHLVDNVLVGGANGVKRLLNADSASIPPGPNGESFDGATHTHYVGEASYTAAFQTLEISNVAEHGHTADMRIYVNKAQEATVRGFSGFVAYVDARLINQSTATVARKPLDVRAPADNRAIGLYGGAEVWVKPWIPANYVWTWDAAGPKPLWFRQRDGTALQGLQMVATNMAYPLTAEYFEREYGVGVYTRTNGSALYIANATYADFSAAAP
jgi:hypothetical protein